MSKVLRFGLLVLLSILYPTTESKSAFKRATENDVKFHKPPSKNHVPLAYQKIGAVVANHIDGHLHISLPIKPFNDSIAMEEKHYEEGKKRLSISLDTYQLCLDDCKRDDKGIFKCHVPRWDFEKLGYYKEIQKCQPYENSDEMELEEANLVNLKELYNVLEKLMSEPQFI